MRLTSSTWSSTAVRNLGLHSYRAAASTERLSSGRSINRAADGPAALTRGIKFAAQMLSTRMVLQNISGGQSMLGIAEGALAQVTSLLQRARDLAVSAGNGTLTDANRASFQQELVHVRSEIDNLTATTTFNGSRVFGDYGLGFVQLRRDSFDSAGGISAFSNTVWLGDRVGLAYLSTGLFSDSFTSTANVDTGSSTALLNTALGKAYSPQAMATAISDTFASLSRIDAGLTTALVDTVAGLVRLGQAANLRASDTFGSNAGTNTSLTTAILNTAGGYVTQGFSTQALFSDTFGDLSRVNGALTTALVDTATGITRLPTGAVTWTNVLSGNPMWQLGQVYNQRLFDTFAGLAGTDPVSTAYVNTGSGLVTAPSITSTLWTESPNFTLPGVAPSWITGGSDTFGSMAQVASSTGLSFDTVAGVVSLLTEAFTIGSDTFADTLNIDMANTTANVDTGTGQVYLNSSVTTESYGDSFSDLTRILSSTGLSVDTVAGTASLGTSLVSLVTDTFADASGISSSSNMIVSGGQVQLDQVLQYNDKYNTTGVFTPGTGANGNFDSQGAYSTSVVDLGNGTLRMYYVTAKQAGQANPTVGYVESTDGGATWSATGTNLSITGVTTSSEVFVTKDTGGTFYMFYSDANGIQMRSSANGTSGWSAATTVLNKGAYSAIGRASVVQDTNTGTFNMFVEVTSGGTKQIARATSATLGGSYTFDATWTNLTGSGPEIVNEGNRYSLYYKDESTGTIVRQTSTDLTSFGTASAALSTGAGGSFDSSAVRTGGAVYDAATGVTRMLYLGRSSATGEWAAGLAYTTERTSGTFVSTLTNTTDTIQNVTLNATEDLTSGTISYRVSTDNGTTWQAVTNGSNISAAAGQQLLIEATLTNTQGVNGGGPALQDYTLSSNLYHASGSFTSTAYTFAQPVDNFTLNANGSTPAGTSIDYEYSMDGGTTWQVFTPGSQVTLGSTTSQVQVRANFATTDRGYTATLNDYTISADTVQYNPTEYLYTKNYTFTDSVDQFELSANQTGSVAWEYSTDGGTTWQAAALGTNSLAGTAQQLKLRARLDAGGGGATTPVISNYSVTASRYAGSGSFTSIDYTFADPVDQIKLTATEGLPGGTGIGYEISTDGGSTWQSVSNGGTVSLGSATTSVKLKATFSTADGYYTPTLSDYLLEGYTTGYDASATYTSAVYNFGYDVQNVTLNVTENKPVGTDISYEISTDNGGSWQAVTPGSNIAVAPGQNLLMRATLSTTDLNVTPELVSYSVTSEQKQSGTVWQSVVTGLPIDATAVRLNAVENLMAGTSIDYEVSADGGTTWTAVTPGSTINLGTPGSQLVVRAAFNSSDPYAAASLEELSVETYDYDTSGTFTSAFQTLATATAQVRLDSALSTVPAGTGVTYQVTNDGGTTWLNANPGDIVTFGSSGTEVGFRAILTGDGSNTPAVNSFSLSVPDATAGYDSDKYLYSTVESYGFDISNVTLNLTENKPGGTDIQYEVSTDGGSTWTAVTAGSNTVVPTGRDLVLRARLLTSDPNFTPELLDYSLSTNQPTPGQEWYSTVTNTGSDVNQVRLTVSENKPVGTDISYYISTDGGTSFQAFAPGSFTSVAPGSNLVLKAVFDSTSGQVAELLDYQLETLDSASPQQVRTTVADIGHDVTQLQLDVNANLPAGTGITYELSNDGGSTWVAATPGTMTNFGTAGRQIAMRATLSGTNVNTPELLDYTIQAPMYTSGVLYSTVQNFGTPISNVTLSANATTPAGTGIQYEVSADGGTTWKPITPGSSLTLDAPTTQLQARATFSSSDGRLTAELLDWAFETRSYYNSGEFTTTAVNLSSPTSQVRLSANAELNGGSVSFEISADGGATWLGVIPGVETDLGTAASQLMLRAQFNSPTGDSTPYLLDLTLEGLTDGAPVSKTVLLQLGTGASDQLDLALPWMDSATLGIDSADISTLSGAGGAIASIDTALRTVNRTRGDIGAMMNRLEHAYSQQARNQEVMTEATSRLLDADMAREAADFVRAQMLVALDSDLIAAAMNGRREVVSMLLRPLPSLPLGPASVGFAAEPRSAPARTEPPPRTQAPALGAKGQAVGLN